MKKLTLSTAVILGTLALGFCINAKYNQNYNSAVHAHKAVNNYDFKKFNGFNLTETLGQADGDSKI